MKNFSKTNLIFSKALFLVVSPLILTFSTSFNTLYASPVTNCGATLYQTQEDFENSNAYVNFSDFSNYVNYSKSIIIPGMLSTNVAGSNCSTMCPQGMCIVNHYVLVSAYDTRGKHKSVIYVINKKTKKLTTTLVLPIKSHVGGIAFDGKNIWVSNDANRVSCFKYSDFSKALKHSSYKVSFTTTQKLGLDDSSSFMTYYNGQLWVGSFLNNDSNKTATHMYSFNIGKKSGTPVLTKSHNLTIPNRVQGAAFINKNTLVLSRAQNVNKSEDKNYISQLDFYQLSFKKGNKHVTGKHSGCFKLPPQNEGIFAFNSDLYVLFESCAYSYRLGDPYECENPVDRICAFPIADLQDFCY